MYRGYVFWCCLALAITIACSLENDYPPLGPAGAPPEPPAAEAPADSESSRPAQIEKLYNATKAPDFPVTFPPNPNSCTNIDWTTTTDPNAGYWALFSPSVITDLLNRGINSVCNATFTVCGAEESDFVGNPYQCTVVSMRATLQVYGPSNPDACRQAKTAAGVADQHECDADIVLSPKSWNSIFWDPQETPSLPNMAEVYIEGPWVGDAPIGFNAESPGSSYDAPGPPIGWIGDAPIPQ